MAGGMWGANVEELRGLGQQPPVGDEGVGGQRHPERGRDRQDLDAHEDEGQRDRQQQPER